MAPNKKARVKIYAVGWRETEPFMVEVPAIETEKTYQSDGDRWFGAKDGYPEAAAFHYMSRVFKDEMAQRGIGRTPKEAIDFAFALEVARKEAALTVINEVERDMTALMKLELRVAKP